MFKIHLAAAIVFFILSLLCSCNNAKEKTFKPTKADTTQTMALYVLGQGKIGLDWVYRVSKDTMKINSDQKVIQSRDTLYYVPMKDSARDKNGKPILDSLGQPKIEIYYPNLPKTHIIKDYFVNSKEIFNPSK